MAEGAGNIKFYFGGRSALRQTAAVAASAQRTLTGDVFVLDDGPIAGAMARSASRNVSTAFVADPEKLHQTARRLPPGATVARYGEYPLKNHAKSFVADRQRAVVTTGAFVDRTRPRFEVTATFEGRAARALDRLTRATAAGGGRRVRAAAESAMRHGIVLNDPRAGVRSLTDSLIRMIDGAEHSLLVVSKRNSSPLIKEHLKAARSRGVEVTKVKTIKKLHANLLVRDGHEIYFGSAHLSKRAINGTGKDGRLSRELGLVIDDARHAARLTRAVHRASHPGGRAVAGAVVGSALVAAAAVVAAAGSR